MTAAAASLAGSLPDRAPEPLRRFRGPARAREGPGWFPDEGWPVPATPRGHSPSVSFAFASIAASDLRTWSRSVVYQKSGSDALR